jgi:hypothetical protein
MSEGATHEDLVFPCGLDMCAFVGALKIKAEVGSLHEDIAYRKLGVVRARHTVSKAPTIGFLAGANLDDNFSIFARS